MRLRHVALACAVLLSLSACSTTQPAAPVSQTGSDGLPVVIDMNAPNAPPVTADDSARVAVDRRERAIYDSLRTLGPAMLSERDVLWMELYDTRQRNRAIEREAQQRSIREAQRDRAIQNTSNAFSAYLMGSLLVGLGSLLFLLTL